MRSATCLCLLVASLAAQPAFDDPAAAAASRKLNATLMSLRDGASRFSVGQQFAADLASVADPDHRPLAKNVKNLADELTAAVSAGSVRFDLLPQVTAPIIAVLHSAGTSTSGFYESVEQAERALTSMGVAAPKARNIAGILKAIGMQVRGPEDFPAR